MTSQQQSRAYRLYRGYHTQTIEYRRIADDLGLSVGQLNAHMWDLRHAREAARRASRQHHQL